MKRLSFEKTRDLLKKYDVRFVESVLIRSEKEALKAARSIGWPVVLKTASSEIVHRTEKGGVALGIENKKKLAAAWKQVSSLGKEAVVQPQVEGTEVVIGMKRDQQFGPVLMFGLGGIFVEVLEDVSFRVAPISEKEARSMIKEVKGYRLLEGFRGRDPVNISSLVETIRGVSGLSLSEEGIREVDLNPVMAGPKGAVVTDAKILTD